MSSGNTSPASRAVNRIPRNTVSILSPSSPHLPSTPMHVGIGRSGYHPAWKPLSVVGVSPLELSGKTGPIFGMELLFQVPPPLHGSHSPSKAGPHELSAPGSPARVSEALTLHSPGPLPRVSVTTKTLPKAFVSSHIPAQLPLVTRWEGCSGETRQETREFKRRGTNMT